MHRLHSVVRYVAPLVLMALILGAERELSVHRLTLDPGTLIILLMIATAWYFGQGPGLLFAAAFELAIDYLTPGPKANARYALIVFNRVLLFFAVVWFASSRRAAERRLRQQRTTLEDTLGREQAAREEAERANRLKDEFLATVSHELRTPLNVIVGWTSMLGRGSLDEDGAKRAVEAIERSAKTQARIVDDLLDASALAGGRLHIRQQRLPLAPIVEDALETMRVAAAVKRIDFDVVLEPAVDVMGDPDRLRQVSWNLIANAIKFTAEGGRVEIRVAGDETRARLSVHDTGAGIAPDFLPHVFEPFRQGDASMTREHGGLGLGLAIVRQLVELHGGTVAAESDGTGRGALFTVELPRATGSRTPRYLEREPKLSAPSYGR